MTTTRRRLGDRDVYQLIHTNLHFPHFTPETDGVMSQWCLRMSRQLRCHISPTIREVEIRRTSIKLFAYNTAMYRRLGIAASVAGQPGISNIAKPLMTGTVCLLGPSQFLVSSEHLAEYVECTLTKQTY